MESLSSQIKQLQTKNQDLSIIENRLIQLKQQLKLQESNNHIIQKKVNKILETKKHTFLDQQELAKRIEKTSTHQSDYHNRIKMMRQIQAEETRRMKEDMIEEKKLKTALTKQQAELISFQHKKQMEEELQNKQSQFCKISEWEFQSKQELELRKIEKIERVRSEQQQFKTQLANKFEQTQKLQQKLLEEEQQLLRKLQNSQQKGQALRQDLSQALNVSIKDYHNQSIIVSSSHKSYSQQKLTKQQLESPYAQIPSILKIRIPKEQQMREIENIFPQLVKPSFAEQQKYMERLCKTKDIFNSQSQTKIPEKQFLTTQGTHLKQTNSSKFETNKTYQNKFLTGTHTSQLKANSTQPREQGTTTKLTETQRSHLDPKPIIKKEVPEKKLSKTIEPMKQSQKQQNKQPEPKQQEEQKEKQVDNEDEGYEEEENYEQDEEEQNENQNEKEPEQNLVKKEDEEGQNEQQKEYQEFYKEQLNEQDNKQEQEKNQEQEEEEEYPPDD